MRVVDRRELEPFIHQVVHLSLVGAIDIVRARRIARELRGVSPVHLILRVTKAHQSPFHAVCQHHPATLARIVGLRVLADGGDFFGGENHPPPPRAGVIATSAPSLSGVEGPSGGLIAPLVTEMLTGWGRFGEPTSGLQSLSTLVCRL